MLGLELRDTVVAAVDIDEGGGVRARAELPIGGDAVSTTLTVLDRVVAAERAAPTTIGMASLVPDSASCQAVWRAVASRYAGLPVVGGVVESGVAAAVAEAWVGAARGESDVVLLSVGVRAIGGVVQGGRPVTGAHGRAAAVAWLALNPVEREDYRKAGCLEAEVAAAGIVRRVIWRIKAGDRSRVSDAVRDDLTAVTVEHVLEAARGGDGVSISVMRDTARYLGMAAANLVAIADPNVLVLGGFTATAADLLFDPVRAELARRLAPAMVKGLTVRPAILGDDAPAIGAARLGGGAVARQ